jgi:hypothetical protein
MRNNAYKGSFHLGLILGAFLSSATALGVAFSNQFIEFELPANWQCKLEGAEWVCQNQIESKKKEAIIVLAAKLKGDQDSLDKYADYLKLPKTFKSVQDKLLKSEVKYSPKNVNINDQIWVDCLHLESELPGYFTRYLATVKQDIGVLITYSVQKAKYSDYQTAFENLTKTLKVFRKQGGLNTASTAGSVFSTGASTVASPDNTLAMPDKLTVNKVKDSSDDSLMLILVIVVAFGGFIAWRRFKK